MSRCGRLRYGYYDRRARILVAFRGVQHVESSITGAATSDDNQCGNRNNHEGEGSKDDTNDDRSDMRTYSWCAATVSTLSWYGIFGFGALRACG